MNTPKTRFTLLTYLFASSYRRSQHPNVHRSQCPNVRRLAAEQLEERTLLSVSPADYAAIAAEFSDFNLPASEEDINIIEIDSSSLSVDNLKTAIATAGTTTKPDLIVVHTSETANTITYANAADEITIDIDSTQYGSITLIGWGDEILTLDAKLLCRVMTVSGNETVANLGGMTITGGKTSGRGGGIYNNDGTLTITNSTISGNTANGSFSGGGGISNHGTLTVSNSTISGNLASSSGGGVYNNHGTLTVTNSVFSGNTADNGGGIYNYYGSPLTVTNSTISGNSVNEEGGGIYNFVESDDRKLTITNSIVARNYASESCNDIYDLLGTFSETSGHNIIGHNPVFVEAPVFDVNGVLTNAQTLDLRLTAGSRAINAGSSAVAIPGLDLAGNPRVTGNSVDIGAYEFQGTPSTEPTTFSTVVDTLEDSFDANDGKWSLREALYWTTGSETITFDDSLTGGTIKLDNRLSVNEVTIDGGSLGITLDAQQKDRVMETSGVVTLYGLTITGGKTSNEGGGIYNYYGTLTVTNSTISGNMADDEGGGIYNCYGTLTVTCSSISGNIANGDGGGICIDGWNGTATLTVTNSTISGNMADDGGGIDNDEGTLTVTNSTISGNMANDGGGISNDDNTLTVTNSIIAQNFASDSFNDLKGTLSETSGHNIIGYNPLFTVAPVFDADGVLTNADTLDLRLTAESHAINAGSSAVAIPGLDLAGNPRVTGNSVDIGAYEFQGTPAAEPTTFSTVVDTLEDSFVADDGKWSLREALYWATAPGTITFDDSLSDGTIYLNSCLDVCEMSIDGGSLGITLDAQENNRVINTSGDVTLIGLTITGGKADNRGGGICNAGTLTVTNSTISGNTLASTYYNSSGGGIYNYGGTLTVTNSTISGNSADFGGGVYNGGALTVTNSTISGNSATRNGGGIYNSDTLTVTNSTISGNTASSSGGGIINSGTLTVTNSTISGNTASGTSYDSGGGGIYNDYGTLTVTNSTISGNTASNYGGGVYNYSSSFNAYNTIIACNTAKNGNDFYKYSGTVNGYHSLSSYTAWGGENNIAYDPEQPFFRSIENGDYRLVPGSQASDMGNNQYAYDAGLDETWFDMAGEPRFIGENIDIGAYESSGLDVSQQSIYTGNVSLSWVQYKNAENLRLTWISGTTATVLGLFGSAGKYTWDTTTYADGNGQLKIEYLDENGKALLTSNIVATILNDANIVVHRGEISADETWNADKVHLVVGKMTVKTGATLTITENAIVKFWKNAYLNTESGSTLTIQDNVVLTRAEDDSIGGDTNKDGVLSVAKMGNAYLRGKGTLDLAPTIERRFEIQNMSGTLSQSETWQPGQVYHVTSTLTVPSGVTLTILPGAVVKFNSGCSLVVQSGGSLVAEGNAAQPIVFTSFKDDSYGGDTNEDDGEYGPEPGDWIAIKNTGGTLNLNYCKVSYGGWGRYSNQNDGMIWNQGGDTQILNSELSHSLLRIVSAPSGVTTIKNSVLSDGRWGVTGSSVITNSIIANCNTGLSGSGTFTNSILYSAPSHTNYNVTYSVFWNSGTLPSGNGNKKADPLFRDAKNGDYRLRAGSPCIDAANSTVATETDIIGAPRYTDVYTTPTGTPNANGEYADIGAYEFTESASSSIDLTPVDVKAPLSVSTGEKVTIQWTVRNDGSAPAIGTWTDEIYLISETGQKVIVADQSHAGNITPGDLQTFYAQVTIPSIKDGTWTFGVHVNPNREIFEGIATENNIVSAAAVTSVSVPQLEEATKSLSITNKTPGLYKVTVAAGKSLWLTASSTQPVSVRMSETIVPTSESTADYVAATYEENKSTLFIPVADTARTFYLLISTTKPAANVDFTISDTSLELLATSLSEVSNQGTSTISFYGAGFDSTTTVSLVQNSTVISGTGLTIASGSQASAKFDLTGVLPGDYNLVVEKNSQTKTLADAVTVRADGVGAVLDAQLTIPDSVREGRVYTSKITYSNIGDCDMCLPTFVITGGNGNLLGMTSDSVESTALNLLGVGAADSAGILRPGEEFSVTFYFVATESTSVSFTPVTTEDDYIGDGMFNTQYWSTWNDFYVDLSAAVTQLYLRGNTTMDFNAAKTFLYALKSGNNSTGLSGYLQNARTGEAISNCWIKASWNDGENYTSCMSDKNGRYVFNYLPENTTVSLSLESAAYDPSSSTVTIAEHDITDFNLAALPYGSLTGRIVNENSRPVSGVLVMAWNDSGDYGYTMTDSYGQYSINNIPLGTYHVNVESAGNYQNIPDQTVDIANATGSTMNFSLTAGNGYDSQNSLTETEYAAIRQTYDTLVFSELHDDMNVIRIAQTDISALSLIRAVYVSSQTAADDLILLQSTEDTTISLNGTPIEINIDEESFGTVSIVNVPDGGEIGIAVNSNDAATFYISQGTLQLANIVFIDIATDDNWSQLGRFCTIEGTTGGEVFNGNLFMQDVSLFDRLGNDIMKTYFTEVVEEDGSIAYYEKELPQNALASDVYTFNAKGNSLSTLSVDNQKESSDEVNNYVILFSGGVDKDQNHSRYYDNIKRLYNVCINKYDIPPENIFVLYADGKDPGKDKNVFLGRSNSNMSFVKNQDNLYSATEVNFIDVCIKVAERIKKDDHLLVYTFDHGETASTENRAYLNLWNDPSSSISKEYKEYIQDYFKISYSLGSPDDLDNCYISDNELSIYTKYFTCYTTYVFAQCYSGGMLDDIKMSSTQFGMAATDPFEVSYNDYFSRGFIGSLESDNYEDGESITGESAFIRAKLLDPAIYNPIPKFSEHPWSTGASFPIFSEFSTLEVPTITITNTTTNSISISWPEIEFANKYHLQISASPDFSSPHSYVSSLTSTTFIGLQENTAYYIRMKAVDTTGKRKDSQWSYTASAKTLQSCDPNEINGLVGYDYQTINTGTEDEPFLVITSPNWITGSEEQAFTIYFENKSTATAAAQEVFVTTTLPEEFDWSTFELQEICIGNQVFDDMVGYADGVWTVEQTSTGNQIQVTCSFDTETGEAKWYLRSWVTTTADHFPVSAYDGFLPPNNKETHDGEGYVQFNILPKADLTSGEEIKLNADIVFDTNEVIVTNMWKNTLDKTLPTAELTRVELQPDNTVELAWTGSDAHSGISGYAVYYSINDGDWQLWQTFDADTTEASFTDLVVGATFKFYVTATDNVGWVGGDPENAVSFLVESDLTTRLIANSLSHATTDVIPDGLEELTDWDSFYVEFWSEGTANVAAGAVVYATIMFDQNLFTCNETFAVQTPDGLTGKIINQSVNDETGQVTLTVQITVGSEDYTAPGANLYWGCVYFTPTLTEGAGLADTYSEADSFGAKVKAVAYDLERNDKVDMTDFIEFAKMFNQKVEGNENPLVAVADFNGSGTVDMADFILFARNFNKKKTDENVTIVHPKPVVAAAEVPVAAAVPVAKPVSESTLVAIPDLSQTRILSSTRLSRVTDAAILDLYDSQYESEAIDVILSEMSDDRFLLD